MTGKNRGFINTLTLFYTDPAVWQRVIVAIILAFTLAHISLYPLGQPVEYDFWAVYASNIGSVLVFILLAGWVLLAGEHTFKAYLRLFVGAYWAFLLQRVLFANISGGTMLFQVTAFILLTGWLSWAFTGMQINETLNYLQQRKRDPNDKDPNTNVVSWRNHSAINE